MTLEVDDFLAHYGVKGMRWGHRKSEEEVTSHREVKAQKFVNKAAVLQTRISTLQSGHVTYGTQIQIDELTAKRDQAFSDADAKRQGKMTSTQKKVLVGASITAGLIAAFLIQDNIQSGEFTRSIAKGKAHFKGEEFSFKKNEKLADRSMSADDVHERVVKHVNPDYGAVGTKMNCRRATFSYEMRRRGYDVRATKTTNANGQTAVGLHNATTTDKKFTSTGRVNTAKVLIKEANGGYFKEKPVTELIGNFAAGSKERIPMGFSPNSIFDHLSNQPNGSRGELGVMWEMGGGHSMAYEIFNGKPVIFDAQSGKKLDNPEAFTKAMGKVKSSGFTRLDNVELNHDYLMRWMTDAK